MVRSERINAVLVQESETFVGLSDLRLNIYQTLTYS